MGSLRPQESFAAAPADPNEALAPYTPGAGRPWDRRHAAHLLRRAGFGGSLEEIDAIVALGPAAGARSLAAAQPDPAVDELDQALEAVLGDDGVQHLRAWWCLRMVRTSAPMREKLGLFLHGHFATGFRKVGSARKMRDQAGLFLALGGGKFRDLTAAVVKDAAMLVYLDGARSEKRRPNENLGRELMELFTLGRGNHTETDVQEAARALTGWRVDARGSHFYPPAFDAGQKTVLGRSGNLGSDDVVDACVAHTACAPFLARKLLVFFALPEPSPALVEAFARRLRECDLDLGAALSVLLASRLFHSDASYRSGVKSPAEYVAGALRALGGRASGPGAARAMSEMGQNLFEPPSVKGWDGGKSWIHSATWLARAQFAFAATASGGALERDFEPARFLGSEDANDPDRAVDRALEILLQGDAPPRAREALTKNLRAAGGGDAALRSMLQAVLLLPEYHCS
jgi:uncharacterized protein (DUF1800 family)